MTGNNIFKNDKEKKIPLFPNWFYIIFEPFLKVNDNSKEDQERVKEKQGILWF